MKQSYAQSVVCICQINALNEPKRFQTQNIRMTRSTPDCVVIFVRTCMILLIFKVDRKMRILTKMYTLISS